MSAVTLVIGTAQEAHKARALGMQVAASCQPVLRSALLGRQSLVRTFAPHLAKRVAVAWNGVTAAIAAHSSRRLLVVNAAGPEGCEELALLARTPRLMGHAEVLPFDSAAAEGWPRTGWRVHAPLTALPALAASQPRDVLRLSWGVGADEFAVGLVGGPPETADAQRAVDVVGRGTLAWGMSERSKLVLVVHPEATNVPSALRWARFTPRLARVALDERMARPWEVAEGLDAAICADVVRHARETPSVLTLLAAAFVRQEIRPSCGSMDARVLARAGVPVLSTLQSSAARGGAVAPEQSFCQLRSTAGAHALLGALRLGARDHSAFHQAVAATQARARELPGAQALVERLTALLAAQRVAA